MWTLNDIFLFKITDKTVWKKILKKIITYYFSNRCSDYFQRKRRKKLSLHYIQNFKNLFENVASVFLQSPSTG